MRVTTYYLVEYSNRAGGSFVEEGNNVTWNAGADSGFIVWDIDLGGNTGKMAIAIIGSSVVPDAADTLTQGGVTADVDTSSQLLYPAYLRDDVSITVNGSDLDCRWTGPALGTSHSFFFDGQTNNVVAGEILTFSGGQECEVITVVSDAGASGELDVRFTSDLDAGLPQDNDTFTGSIAGDGTLNGEIHPRYYRYLELHRLSTDLNDDGTIAGDDDLSMVDPTATDRSTDDIITALGNYNIDDTVAQHMFGGSWTQRGGNEVYTGLNLNVTTPNADTIPLLIQNDALVTEYWGNALMPDSVAGRIRISIKTREDGVNIDGGRATSKLAEFGDFYFEGGTVLSTGQGSISVFSSPDGNNQTAEGTVAGAPYNTIVLTEGFQTLDFNDGSGATPFGLSIDFGTANALQTYERTKYIQRRGTAETLFGRNAQLVTGINRNWAYDNETGGPYQEDEILAYGVEVPYTGETNGPFVLGEVIEDTVTGARGRIIYLDDQGATGTLILADTEGTFGNTNALSTVRGAGETTATSGTVVTNAASGTMLLIALDDDGATGNLYCQQLTGVVPLDNQTVFGRTSLAQSDVNGAVATRTINNQFVGTFTGSNYNPVNFGIAIDPSDAIAGDQFTNLLEATISPPDNRTGTVTNLTVGDRVSVYPWDGAATDVNGDPLPTFAEMTLQTALTAGVSTTVDVGIGNIPDNTPAAGSLRIERDSDSNLDLVEYASFSNATGLFTLVGTAPSNAAISNTVMRALIDETATGVSASYTATFAGGGEQVAITVRRGTTSPVIKDFKTSATFGPFSVATIRTPDE